MAYIEHDQLDAQLKKLENVCAENGFTYKFLRDKYPVRIIITPDGTMDGQMSMLDNPVGYNTKGSALAFVFVDGDVYLNPGKEGGLSLSKRLQNKLRTIAEKVYFNYLKVFFIDTLEAKKMADKLHNSDADESHTQDPEFEAIGAEFLLPDPPAEDRAALHSPSASQSRRSGNGIHWFRCFCCGEWRSCAELTGGRELLHFSYS